MTLTFDAGVVSASLDSSSPAQLTLDAVLDLRAFLGGSTVVVGAAMIQAGSARDAYATSGGGGDTDVVTAIVGRQSVGDVTGPYFRGCLGEVRLGFSVSVDFVFKFVCSGSSWRRPTSVLHRGRVGEQHSRKEV